MPTFSADTIIPTILNLILVVATVAFLFMFMSGGISWMLSGGKEEKVDVAKAKLRNALIGLFIVLLSWPILAYVGDVFGVDLTSFEIPDF